MRPTKFCFEELLEEVRNSIPIEQLRDADGPYSRPEDVQLASCSKNLVFLQRLCRYFKEIMTWVNQPNCVGCGGEQPELLHVRGAITDEEREGKAGRVEVYRCYQCHAETLFPRYNSVKKLFETKSGRCGEYANLFGLYCRSVGFDVRYIHDSTDHVWVEVLIEDRWVMADGCEGVIDEPSMYEAGWGKQGISLVIATSIDQVTDVTPVYTRKFLSRETQSLRRKHMTSEAIGARIIEQINSQLEGHNANPKSRLVERRTLEAAQLKKLMQATEWLAEERYQRGRSSGSLSWRQARGETGKESPTSNHDEGEKDAVAGFQFESFLPPTSSTVSISVIPHPTISRGGIVVSGSSCAVGEPNTVSVVIVDEKVLGCILQSRCFRSLSAFRAFIDTVPAGRLIAANGSFENDVDEDSESLECPRLHGFSAKAKGPEGFIYIGQIDACPDWTFFSTFESFEEEGYQVVIDCDNSIADLKLKNERNTRPSVVAGRIPESHMPLATQVQASEEQKRIAFESFSGNSANNRCYSGYTSWPGSPIYLLDASAYPLVSVKQTSALDSSNATTFHYLPAPLVPLDEQGVDDSQSPEFHIPLDDMYATYLGTKLLVTSTNTSLPTNEALCNARLIGLYFSAVCVHFCRIIFQCLFILAPSVLSSHLPSISTGAALVVSSPQRLLSSTVISKRSMRTMGLNWCLSAQIGTNLHSTITIVQCRG